MTNAKNIRKALFMSMISLLICFSMLVGTTFAWFTDSVTSANNVIQSGNLDIELEYWNGTDWADIAGKSDILTNTLWEPGVTEVAYLKITNAGSLALKYQLGINIVNEIDGVNYAGDPFKLSDYIQFGVVELDSFAAYATREDAVAAVTEAKKISAGYTKSSELTAGADPVYLALVVYMPTEVGNAANHNDVNVPKIDLGINVFATQMKAELDSFGNDYDEESPIILTSPMIELPSGGVLATEDAVVDTKDATFTFSEAFLNTLAANGDAPSSMAVSYTKPTFDQADNKLSFEFVELVDENGDIIDLEALGNTEDIDVKIYVGDKFNAGQTVRVYHDDTVAADMITVDADGYISYTAKHFCKVSVDLYAAQVNANYYLSIDDAIANWTANSTLKLLSDVKLNDVITLKSTEHHILDLGTYTMTAASEKNAIEIKACGTGAGEKTAITVKADATNPGGINAGKKAVIYYDYSKGGISGEDRPIIRIESGVFTGSTSSFGTAGIYAKGTAARKCATFSISGGTFNCSILGTGKSKMIISGGTFNASVSSQGDSTCYRHISGGTFKTLGFMTADASSKFGIGSALGNYNVGVYVDDAGYLVVGGAVITEASDRFEASSANYSGWSSYLKYSSAAANGLYYTSAKEAFADNNKSTGSVTVYVDKLDMTDITYKGKICFSGTLTVTFAEGTDPDWSVEEEAVYTESTANGVVTRVYTK